MRLILIVTSIAVSCLLLTSCSLRPVAAEITNNYALTAVVNNRLAVKTTPLTLLVAMPTADSGYQSAAMLYQTSPYRLEKYVKNRWLAPPARLLAPLIAQSLRNTGYFRAVAVSPFPGETDLTLNTQLTQFQQEFHQENSQFHIQLEAQLITSKNGKIVAEQQFEATVKASQNNPEGGVVAANIASNQILQQLARWCVAYADK